jgi:hypothetical protein
LEIIVRASIPESALPTSLSADNRLTTIYPTHVLFPKLGPLAAQRYTQQYARVVRDYAAAAELVVAAREFAQTYGKPAAVPAPPPPGSVEDLRLEPPLTGTNAYFSGYLAGLAPFSSARVRERRGTRDGGLRVARFEATAVWPSEVEEVLRDEPELDVTDTGRLIIQPISPEHLIARIATLARGEEWAGSDRVVVDGATVETETTSAAEGYALAKILHGLARPNVVMADMLALDLVNQSGAWLGNELADAADVVLELATQLAGQAEGVTVRERELRVLIERATGLLETLGVTGSALLDRLKDSAPVRRAAFRYVVWKGDLLNTLDPSIVPLPDDTVVVGSREWAFSRTERLSIEVGTPTLRGPFATDAVAPASELVTSESSLQEVVAFSEEVSGRASTRVSETATFNSSTFRQALSHMAEEGVNDEAAFAQDTTLFESLRERRREAIDRTLTQISTNNEQRTGVVGRTVTSTARSYTTRGKDERYATTEVSFQVAAPIDVEVRLEDVGLVWCPRMPSPFMALHRLIYAFEEQARRDYLLQNQVVDPVRPPEVFETASFAREQGIRGNTKNQSVTFTFPIPAQYLDWELDRAATKIDFRNGTIDDYNFDEAWNWDDLENWLASISSISRVGNDITGVAVLETTDPELLNRGFLTFDFAMKRLTDESRVAIEAYERDRQDAAAQRQAVEVRARQYARLRRDELIEQYESSYELQEEAFAVLVKRVFQGTNPDHVSYWREILRSCVEWSRVAMRMEPGDMATLAHPQLSPSHFMNAQGIRFILPILRSAEAAFFEALETGAGTYHSRAAATVREFVNDYRDRVEALKEDDPDDLLVLDAYMSEMVLGRHLEAVMSAHPFAEPA